jgi:hypothetical protein
MITVEKYEKLRDKFKEKGDLEGFYWLVVPPLPFEYGKTFGTYEEQVETYKNIVETVYGKDWDEMSVWIDHQNYK